MNNVKARAIAFFCHLSFGFDQTFGLSKAVKKIFILESVVIPVKTCLPAGRRVSRPVLLQTRNHSNFSTWIPD
jgi:hypothetical protein